MNFSLKKLMGSPSASAEVVDNHLVLSFPEAVDPIVWRMSLDKIGTASFEVKQDSDSDQTKLILKPKKGTTEIIASFATKKEAVDALMIASKALQQTGANTQTTQKKTIIQPSQEENNSHETVIINSTNTTTEKQKWFLALIGAFIVLGLYYYLTSLIPETVQNFGSSATSSVSSNPTEASGVPVSADDFLSGF